MDKKLKSGIVVHSNEYYALLDWKDKNKKLFEQWLINHFGKDFDIKYYSINNYSWKEYNDIILFVSKMKDFSY